MIGSSSLFDPRPESGVEAAAGWLLELLTGPAATSLCVIAVALLGVAMLSGRVAPRRGAQVVLGSFLLLGASSLAAELRGLAVDAGGGAPAELVIEVDRPPPLPPANYDPYAGASLRKK